MIEHLSRILGDGPAATVTLDRLPDLWDIGFGLIGAGMIVGITWMRFFW